MPPKTPTTPEPVAEQTEAPRNLIAVHQLSEAKADEPAPRWRAAWRNEQTGEVRPGGVFHDNAAIHDWDDAEMGLVDAAGQYHDFPAARAAAGPAWFRRARQLVGQGRPLAPHEAADVVHAMMIAPHTSRPRWQLVHQALTEGDPEVQAYAQQVLDPAKMRATGRAKERSRAVAAQEEAYQGQALELGDHTHLPPDQVDALARGKDVWLYHGTSSRLVPQIRRHGLVADPAHGRTANHTKTPGVYLTARPGASLAEGGTAQGYAHQAVQEFGGRPVVLRVKVPYNDLRPDPDDEDISAGRHQFVTDHVPPEGIYEVGDKRIRKFEGEWAPLAKAEPGGAADDDCDRCDRKATWGVLSAEGKAYTPACEDCRAEVKAELERQDDFSGFKPIGEIRVKKDEEPPDEDLDKRLAALPPGVPVKAGTYSYDHVLSPEHRAAGYSLHVREEAGAHPFEAVLSHQGRPIGEVMLERTGEAVTPHSSLDKEHRGRGLGQAMYEAAYRHAMYRGMYRVAGGAHTAAAGRVHEALAARHGLSYQAPAMGHFRPEYSYALKAEAPAGEELGKAHDTPEFQEWFQGSKVVDAEGRPQRVFHGTAPQGYTWHPQHGFQLHGEDFSSFNIPAYFTTNPSYAGEFAQAQANIRAMGNGSRIVPAHLSIRNPFDARADKTYWKKFRQNTASEMARLKAAGHDGIVMKETDRPEHAGDVYVAFHPHQIKSIFNSRPSSESGDIGKSELEKATKPEHFRAIARASTPEGAKLVDAAPEPAAHPPALEPDVKTYREHILQSAAPARTKSKSKAGLSAGITRKLVYQGPAGQQYMVKPYHEGVIRRVSGWMKHPIQGWAEMTNQALYHAAGIGDLHQKVHVDEHDMGAGKEREPALVVHLVPGHVTVNDAKPKREYKNGFDENGKMIASPGRITDETRTGVRKIALMDFLTNNLDRHTGNLLVHESGKPLAIDHSRSFQYIDNPERRRMDWAGKTINPKADDAFVRYHTESSVQWADPQLGTEYQKKYQDYDAQHKMLEAYQPVFDWWGEVGPQVRAAFDKRLGQIKDPDVRDHVKRNFHARADWLDDRARNGLENFGTDWWRDPVEHYDPGKYTADELDDPKYMAEVHARRHAEYEAKRAARRAKSAHKKWERERPPYPHHVPHVMDEAAGRYGPDINHPDWKRYTEAYRIWSARKPGTIK